MESRIFREYYIAKNIMRQPCLLVTLRRRTCPISFCIFILLPITIYKPSYLCVMYYYSPMKVVS